jgi:hypothetical protein
MSSFLQFDYGSGESLDIHPKSCWGQTPFVFVDGPFQARICGFFGLIAAGGASALNDRRRLICDKLPGAVLAHPDREIAIVNVYDRASDQDLGRG